MKTEGTNLFLLAIAAFWSSSRWPLWAPEGREVSHWVVFIDMFHCDNKPPSMPFCNKVKNLDQ